MQAALAPKPEESKAHAAPVPADGGRAGTPLFLRRQTTDLPIADPDSAAEREAAALARGAPAGGSASRLARQTPSAGPSKVPGSAGHPMEPDLRRDFEEPLEADLADVRIHDDPLSHAFARDVGAQAATWGSHVYFARNRFAPGTVAGRELLRHELVHTLQPEARAALHRTPEEERLREIEGQLASSVITDEYRTELEQERAVLARPGVGALESGDGLQLDDSLLPGALWGTDQPIPVMSMSEAEFEAMTGMPASSIPESVPPMAPLAAGSSEGTLPAWSSAVPGSLGVGSLFTPQQNWYYRVLAATDPTAAGIRAGADLMPRLPDPGFTFEPAASRAEMTFRHVRPGGNVPRIGTDRISTAADLDAFQNLLRNRGTGELVRVDVNAARRLGTQFLEHGDILGDLDLIERNLVAELEAARSAGRGRTFISRLEGRLRALEAARDFARAFQEGQGIESISSRSITQVRGANLGEAVAGERALLGRIQFLRYAGRVFLIVGAGMSVARVATASPEEQGRVAAQEAGGWAFSLAGGALGAKAGAGVGAGFGIESGPGVLLITALGTLIGGALGFFGGEAAADEIYSVGEDIADSFEILGDTPRFIEGSLWLVGTPEDRREYYETREILTGEPPPWEEW